jgi:hypothetical protein
MRGITIRQPWAWAVVHGTKGVENRSQGQRYRGPVFIHTAVQMSDRGEKDLRVMNDAAGARATIEELTLCGHVIGVALLVDSHRDVGCCRPWGESEYRQADGDRRSSIFHLVLEHRRPLRRTIPARGQLGLWKPDPDLLAELDGIRVGVGGPGHRAEECGRYHPTKDHDQWHAEQPHATLL